MHQRRVRGVYGRRARGRSGGRLERDRLERLAARAHMGGIVGVNVGANKDSSDRVADYARHRPHYPAALLDLLKPIKCTYKSGGKMQVKLFTGGILGSDQANVSAIQGGTLDMAVMNTGILASVAKEMAIFDFPFLFANEKESDALVDGPVGLLPLTAAFVADDGTIINMADMKPRTTNSHCSKKPVRFVLEMNRGWFDKKGIKPGAKLGGTPFGPR